MKKIFLGLLLLFVFLLTGCQNYNEKSIKNDINKNYKNLKGYHILGKLEVYSGDNTYKYNVESSKYNDNYRVLLVNKNNNHEQIIIKNDDGVYVLTPSLNKTFKFQSNWPENSSQVYLLDSIINDINSDQKMALVKKNDSYIVEANLAYSNNKNLVKEKIYFDKKINLKKIEVYDNDNVLQMKMTFDEIDKRSTFNDNYFSVKENMKTDSIKTEETMSEIEDAIYPMYLPSGTYLSSEENVSIDGGERVILTFSGESPFILVQETVNANEEDIPVSGEPEFILDTLGAVSLNSVNFISNGIEYYLSSDSLTVEEMMQVANSISPVAVMK
ncbi:MAG: outer membrane lipoprotein carrier protein LolA [Bacilli bacterium]|nr:outer membrane lipoprotein carrier protein LolA [Bacilli bacterium]